MAVRKLPLQQIAFRGELKDFLYFSTIEPADSSFFGAFGVGLLESLIRLKNYQEITQPTWEAFLSATNSCKDLSKKYNLQSLYNKFCSLVEAIHSASERKDAMALIASYIDKNDLLCVDYGIRLVLMFVSKAQTIINGKIRNFDYMLSLLSQSLYINVFLVVKQKYKIIKCSDTSMLICLYCHGPGNFAVLYHRAAKYLDEKLDPIYIDPLSFPFTSTVLAKEESSDNFSAVVDLISFISENTNVLPPLLQLQLKNKIEAAGIEIPDILEIEQLKILAGKFLCSHKEGNILSACGKFHCKKCLDINGQCPCGIAETEKGIDKRRSLSTTRQRTRNRMYPELSLKKNKVMCLECKKNVEFEEYSLISCKDHHVCSKCRARRVNRGNYRCSQCSRDYQPHEISLLLEMNQK